MMLKYQTSLLSQFHYDNYNGLLTFTLHSIIASAMIASNVICDMFSFSLTQHRMLKNSLKSTEDECMPLTLINYTNSVRSPTLVPTHYNIKLPTPSRSTFGIMSIYARLSDFVHLHFILNPAYF